jgi:glycosyltransferase involved in cell wall biosynthesis
MIKVLHLFANHKITGPAELALETARWLPLVNPDIEAPFYSSEVKSQGHKKDRWLQILAKERQLCEPDWTGVKLPKHFSPISAYLDVRRLVKRLRNDQPEIIHTHSANDHLIGGLTARRLGTKTPIIVRTLYDGEVPPANARRRYIYSRLTDLLICFSQAMADKMLKADLGLCAEQIHVLPPPIDTDRFDPSRTLPNIRDRLHIPMDAPVYGIVARMQTHRRFEVLIEAMAQVAKELPESRAIIVGRGTNQQVVARKPVVDKGLSDHAIFSGYLSGDDYVGVLAAMNLKLFLVPGSDGTCRAAREALAMGVPVLAAKRGMLPEIIQDGLTGRVIDDHADNLARNIVELLSDSAALKTMSNTARTDSVERCSFRAYAKSLAVIYRDALDCHPSSRPSP